jgi:hypothetical protein
MWWFENIYIYIYNCFLPVSSLVGSRTATQKRKKKYIFTVPFNLPCLYANRSRPYQLTMFLRKATSRVIEFEIYHTSLRAFIIASNGKKLTTCSLDQLRWLIKTFLNLRQVLALIWVRWPRKGNPTLWRKPR